MEKTLQAANQELLEKKRLLDQEQANEGPQNLVPNFLKAFNFDSKEVREHQDRLAAQAIEEQARVIKREEMEKENKILRYWNNSGVPLRHAKFEMPFEGDWIKAYDSLVSLNSTGYLFVVMGRRGTGKTQLGTCLVRNACENLRTAKYVKALDVFISLRASYRKDGPSEEQIINEFTQPRLLVIDALEERGETPFEDRLLNHIIDKRYDNLDDTLLITNQTEEGFAESVGPSIVSRIIETGGKINFDWETFRVKKAA